jgi:alpha-galactosidase
LPENTYFSITDTYYPLSNCRPFYEMSYVLPAAMLESNVEKWPVPMLKNFLYMLRKGMMGWVSIMQDTTAWNAEQHEAARQAIALYKEQLRPLIRDARLYHVSDRPDGVHWDGMEHWDAMRRKGVVYAFRGTIATEAEHRFVLDGLDSAACYALHFAVGSAPDRQEWGRALMQAGVSVHLSSPLSLELIFLHSAGPACRAGAEDRMQ